MPRLKKWVKAPYPPKALAANRAAKVLLHVTIDPDGKVVAVQVVKLLDEKGRQVPLKPEEELYRYGFHTAATEAARKFEFFPATLNGKPIRVKIAVVYPFVIRKPEPPRPVPGTRTPTPPGRPGTRAATRPTAPGSTEPRLPARPSAPGPEPPPPAWAAELKGWIVEKGSRNPVEDAKCVLFRLGPGNSERRAAETYTNEKGWFAFAGIKPGRYRVMVRSADHSPYSGTEKLAAGQRVKVRYYLERITYGVYETVVTSTAKRKEVSRHTVALPEIQRIPGTQGDALRAVQNMPGMARASFGGGALVVRGSAPGDTGVYLHGHPIPMLYHFMGLTSVINSDVLKSIEFVPGNFSARFGRAMGGIIDVKTREPKKRWSGYVDIDIWDASLLLEGPVGKLGSFAVTARRSYIDSVIKLLPAERFGINFVTAPVYYDYLAMTDLKLGGGRFKALAMGSDDRLAILFNEPTSIAPTASGARVSMMFHRALSLYTRRWGDTELDSSFSSGFTRVNARLGDELKLTFNYVDLVWRAEVSRRFNRYVKVSGGIDGNLMIAWADVKLPSQLGQEGEAGNPWITEDSEVSTGRKAFFGQAVYLESEIKPHKNLAVVPGLRLDYEQRLEFSRVSFDPRLTTTWTVHKRVDLKAGVGLFHQPPGFENLWPGVGGNPDVGYQRALHVSAGVKWRAQGGVEVSSTGFYKHMTNLVTRSYNVVVRDGEIVAESVANVGLGRVYGLELLLKKPLTGYCPQVIGIRRCFGWISYTLMKSERKEADVLSDILRPSSYDTTWRPFEWDQTHILTVVLSVIFKHGWELGIRFRYVTGNPSTPYLGGIYDSDNDTYIGVPGTVNSARLPDFHQLDVRLDKRWVFKKWILHTYIDVQNVYNRKNPEFARHNFNYTQTGYFPGLPIIPSIGIKGQF